MLLLWLVNLTLHDILHPKCWVRFRSDVDAMLERAVLTLPGYSSPIIVEQVLVHIGQGKPYQTFKMHSDNSCIGVQVMK